MYHQKVILFQYFLRIFSQKHHIKRTQKGFKSLKIDSFQGLRPWTPSGGLQRPQTPSWLCAGGFAPPAPPCWLSTAIISVSQAHTFSMLHLSKPIPHHWKSITHAPHWALIAPPVPPTPGKQCRPLRSQCFMTDLFLKMGLSSVAQKSLGLW